jgi:ribosomal protein S18 acetylase RimI-like enzyme
MSSPECLCGVRPYERRDRAAVWQLAADTAFFGDPVEAFLDDRAAFCEAFIAYYTDHEPEHLWVAETNGDVVGYVSGGTDSRRTCAMAARILPRAVGCLLIGQVQVGCKTLRFCRRGLLAWLRRELPDVSRSSHPWGTRFPAHLHLNVAAAMRGRGVGRALLHACLARFWVEGVSGVYLHTTDRNRAACHLYERTGFRLLGARATTLWHGLVDGPVENRVYGIVPAWEVSCASECVRRVS